MVQKPASYLERFVESRDRVLKELTVRSKTISNDFSVFENYLAHSKSIFVVEEIII